MKARIALLAVLLALSMRAGIAGQRENVAAPHATGSRLSVRPSALGPLVDDQNIKMMLKDGTYVEGKVDLATEHELQVNVKHCEPKDRIKKGEARIPTHDISVVYIKRKGPVAVPVILGVAGGLGGLLVGSYAGYSANSASACAGLGIGLAAAGATGGAYLGIEAAKRTVTINVVEPKQAGVDGDGYSAKN